MTVGLFCDVFEIKRDVGRKKPISHTLTFNLFFNISTNTQTTGTNRARTRSKTRATSNWWAI